MRSFFVGLCALLSVATAGLAVPQPLSARHPPVPIEPGHVRLLIYLKKRDDISFQQFSDHWRVIHPPLFLDTKAVKENVTRYEQYHVNQEWKQKLIQEGKSVAPNVDGIVLIEAESMDKALSAFSGDEYVEKVFPDSVQWSDVSSNIVASSFQIATVFDKEPKPVPASQLGVIRTDIQTLLVDVQRKSGMSVSEFGTYWREVNAPHLQHLMEETGAGAGLTKNELLTVDPDVGNTPTPFPIEAVSYDGMSVFNGPSIKTIFENLKDQKLVSFFQQDAPNFVNVNKPIGYLPVDVVTFNIDKS
ncbi:hypothetical protein PQX77_009087 [Marasmius sp. AFHP31]|nr:hypothetical protein PQX77_009087 [Marasmius sp. AFHP31]